MKLTHLAIQRTVATVLSASVVWLMVACLSLCSSHCAESEETCSVMAPVEIDAAHETDCCPITSAPVSLKPERLSLNLQATNAGQAVVTSAAQSFNASFPLTARIEVPYPSSSPPLLQSCVLRI